MIPEPIKPNVYEFTDYRSFLVEFVNLKRKQQPHWSLGQWARSLDLSATTSLTMVLNGQRNPGEKLAFSLAKYFKFAPDEKAYFLNLVELSKASKQSRLKSILEQEVLNQAKRKHSKPIDPQLFALITNWYCVVIRQIARSGKLSANANINIEELQKKLLFPVSKIDLKAAIDTLLKIGLLKTTSNQELSVSDEQITTESDVARESYKIYHEQMISLAKTSIRTTPVTEREITGLTLPIAKDNLAKAKELIKKFVDDFDSLVENTKGDSVYQLNVQFFPIADLAADKITVAESKDIIQ